MFYRQKHFSKSKMYLNLYSIAFLFLIGNLSVVANLVPHIVPQAKPVNEESEVFEWF